MIRRHMRLGFAAAPRLSTESRESRESRELALELDLLGPLPLGRAMLGFGT